MRSRFGLIFAPALGAVLAAPLLARADELILPPYDGSAPPPKVATDAQALAVLHHRGIARVSNFGRVGDYWESDGTLAGKPVIAYVFTDGALEIQPAAPGERVPAPPQSAQLPQ
jgi:hypothetical protein